MEGETVDYSARENAAFTSILQYNQDRNQSGEYIDYDAQELFSDSLRYFININLFRPLNIDQDETDEEAPVSLGTSCFMLNSYNDQVPTLSQGELLKEHNLLRPKGSQGWSNGSQMDCQMDCQLDYPMTDIHESEFGKNFQLSAPAGGAYPGYGFISPDATQPRMPAQVRIQGEQPHMNEVMTGDRDLVDTGSQNWRSPDNTSVVKIEEKAAIAADRFLDTARHQTGLSAVRDDHLDGPVFSILTSDEDEVGQYNDYSVSSDEFECDGNSSTSLTGNSRE